MADFKCTGDCIKCSAPQRIYCSAQRTYAILEAQNSILSQLAEIRERLNKEETVTPIKDETGTTEDGAENRDS